MKLATDDYHVVFSFRLIFTVARLTVSRVYMLLNMYVVEAM